MAWEIVSSWMLSLFIAGYVFPRLMQLFSYETGGYTHPAWFYAPSALMWIMFFKRYPDSTYLVPGIVACLGFLVSIWYWRSWMRLGDEEVN